MKMPKKKLSNIQQNDTLVSEMRHTFTALAISHVRYLRRRLGAARRRMRYWSGISGPSGYKLKGGKQAQHQMVYEIALCDAQSLAGEIGRLTGETPEVKDIRKEFQQRF